MDDILQSLRLFLQDHRPGTYFEVRALRRKPGAATVGYFNDPEAAATGIALLDATGLYKGIYVCLNSEVLDPPAPNQFVPARKGQQVTDEDINRYYWFLLDFDPPRPEEHTKDSATDAEMAVARRSCFETVKFLREELGWPKPFIAMSGNGYHVMWPFAEDENHPGIPVTDKTKEVFQKALMVLDDRFGNLDKRVFNPSRIWKIPGTMARKGEHSEQRPHRRATVLSAERNAITFDHLLDIVRQAITEDDGEETDVKLTRLMEWMAQEFPDAKGPKRYLGSGNKWEFPVCPWDDSHRDGSAFVIRFPSGAIVAGCHHNSCPGHARDEAGKLTGWRSLQDMASRPCYGATTLAAGPSTREAPGFTDLGNAKRLVNLYGEDIRYVPELGNWMFWNGKCWAEDTTGKIHRRAAGTVATIFAQAEVEADPDTRKAARKWAEKSESYKALRAMVRLAESEAEVVKPVAEFDSDPWLLGVENGVLDLRTRELRDHARDFYLSSVSPVRYDPSAECPLWDAVVARSMGDDPELIAFLYRALGYSMTGLANEHVMFFAHGAGANGKSTILGTVRKILGALGRHIDPNILMVNKSDQHSTGLTDLKGLRLALAAETRKDKRLADDVIKRITGEEEITARRMRQDNMTFPVTHKLWMMTNHRPIILGNDEGIWRRLVYIPFLVVVPKEERDPALPEKLWAEAPGILNRLLAGCQAWQERGLDVPDIARAQVEDYQHEMDPLSEFFEDCCIIEEGKRVAKTDLFEAFCEWRAQRRGSTVSYRHFNRLMNERNFDGKGVTTIEGRSVRIWRGITLRDHVVTEITITA